MKITFFSNFLNHHQLPLCLNFYNNPNIDFKFVATEKIPEERIKLGYEDMNSTYDFVIKTYDSKENYNEAKRLCIESDIIIIGSAPEEFIYKRLKETNKLTFRYSERMFKKGLYMILHPKILGSMLKNNIRYINKNLYLLCSSAYAAGDFSLIGTYKEKAYKWGYFPEVKQYNIKELIQKKEEKTTILWVGRYLDWKHPELVVKVAKKLAKNGYSFVIKMIGTGPVEEKIKKMVIKNKLEEYIHVLGAKSNNEVRKYMEAANIYLFTSDRNEGWGAVLNEAMNSGCAVVADELIGAVPFLIKNGENGLVYKSKNLKSLYEKVELLIDNNKLREKLGEEAYKTVKETWNANVACNNLLVLAKNIINKESLEILEGPCSKAKVIIK